MKWTNDRKLIGDLLFRTGALNEPRKIVVMTDGIGFRQNLREHGFDSFKAYYEWLESGALGCRKIVSIKAELKRGEES